MVNVRIRYLCSYKWPRGKRTFYFTCDRVQKVYSCNINHFHTFFKKTIAKVTNNPTNPTIVEMTPRFWPTFCGTDYVRDFSEPCESKANDDKKSLWGSLCLIALPTFCGPDYVRDFSEPCESKVNDDKKSRCESPYLIALQSGSMLENGKRSCKVFVFIQMAKR